MPPKVQQKDTRTPEQIAIESAKNSNYNIFIPMKDALYIRVKNPLTGRDPHYSTSDTAFYDLYKELSDAGLQSKLDSELSFFAQNYNSHWTQVIQNIAEYLNPDQEDQTCAEQE